MNKEMIIVLDLIVLMACLLPLGMQAQQGTFRFAQLTDIHLTPNNPNPTEDHEIMKKKNKDLILVFVSGIYLPTPESFCVQPYRYLLKQSNPSEIQRELGTILTYTKEHKGKKYFIVEDDGMYQKIDIDEILYFSIIRRGCEIHILQNGTGKILRTRKRIQEIEEELRREYFCRIHKSFLVNPRYITEVKKSEIKMDNNEILSVSKAKRKTFEDMFAEYLSYRK